MLLSNKTIVITGACSGIGAETARLMRMQGARVIGLDRNDPMLTLDGFVKADLSTEAGVDDAVKQLPERIDALCNVAGVPGTSPVDLVGRVNFLSLRDLTEKLIDRMPAGSSVVNFASILGYFYGQRLEKHKALAQTKDFSSGQTWLKSNPVEQKTCYEYFKEVLIVWSMQRSHTLFMQKDIRMNIVSPGPVFTPILGEFVAQLGQERVQADAARMKRPAFADEIAPVVSFLCSDAARWINGANVPVDGGFAATYL